MIKFSLGSSVDSGTYSITLKCIDTPDRPDSNYLGLYVGNIYIFIDDIICFDMQPNDNLTKRIKREQEVISTLEGNYGIREFTSLTRGLVAKASGIYQSVLKSLVSESEYERIIDEIKEMGLISL